MDRPLSKYESQVNAAAFALCKDNISLLSDKKKLFVLAKQKVDSDGYDYKKKRSRSKVYGSSAQRDECGETAEKKTKVVKEVRDKRIVVIQEDIASCKETIKLLEQQRNKFVTSEKYLQAAEIVEQVKNKRKDMRELELELAKLQKAEARSTKYHKTKNLQRKTSSCQQKLVFNRHIQPKSTEPKSTVVSIDVVDPTFDQADNLESTKASSSTGCVQQDKTISEESSMLEDNNDKNFC